MRCVEVLKADKACFRAVRISISLGIRIKLPLSIAVVACEGLALSQYLCLRNRGTFHWS
jgi:hypothetical protein